MGSSVSEQQPELIADHFQSATFLIDPDEAGRKLARQAVDLLHGRIFLKLLFPAMQADQMTADDMKRVFDSLSIYNGRINGNESTKRQWKFSGCDDAADSNASAVRQ